MLARDLISREQYEAGCQYATLYIQTVAPTTVSVASHYRRLLAEGGGGQEIEEEDLRRLQALFRLGKNRLLAAGRRVVAATENIAVFGRPARFLSRSATMTLKRGADFAELQAVLDGLSVLVACYGRGAGRRGRLETHKSPSMPSAAATSGARRLRAFATELILLFPSSPRKRGSRASGKLLSMWPCIPARGNDGRKFGNC